MPIYVNGKKVSAIYSNGQSVGSVYAQGQLVFTKKQGWQQGQNLILTVKSANNNSISGTITFYRYDYYDNGAITETYYQVAGKELTRTTEGVVSLSLGAGTAIVYGDAINNADYTVPSSGTIVLSASELNTLFRIRKSSGVLNLGTSMSVTSNYLEPIQDMAISQLGSDLYLTTGWAIAHNRTSRIKTSSAITTTLSNLAVPGEGTYPVYAVASSGTEVTISSVTCSVGAHYSFDSQNIRHLGWVTVSGGAITNVISLNAATGSSWTKSISGSTLTVGAGYATDTDGCKVYVPGFTYSFADMVTAAADKTSYTSWSQVVDYDSGNQSHTGNETSGTDTIYLTHTPTISVSTTSGMESRVTSSATNYASHNNKGISVLFTDGTTQDLSTSGTSAGSSTAGIALTSGKVIKNFRLRMKLTKESSTGTFMLYSSTSTYHKHSINAWTRKKTTTAGKTQTRDLYVKVTRNQNSNSKSTATQTSTGDSSPYVSYIKVGTITVTRNSSTGTIS